MSEEIADEKETPTSAADFAESKSSASDDAREAESTEEAGGKETTGPETPAPTTEEAAAPETPEWVSIRDVAKAKAGFDPAMWKDDEHATNEIVDGYKKFREMETDYELYQRMKPQFQNWMAGQAPQSPQPQAAPEAPKWFEPPEFRQEWLKDMELGEDGSVRPKTGRTVSPDKLVKVANFIQWRQEVQERLLNNPQEAIREMVSGHVAEESRKIAAEHVEQLRLQNEAQSWADRNSGWLFRMNDKGQKVVDPITRKPVLTDEGQMFGQYFSQAEQLGMRDMNQMLEYAQSMLERHLLRQHYDRNPAEKPPEGKEVVKAALTKASRTPKRAASQASNDPGKSAQNSKADLGTQMLQALKEAGITELD